MDRIRPSLRRDIGAGTAGGSGAGSAVRLFAGDAVDFDRGHAWRGGAGFRGAVLFNTAQWQITGADGQGGTEYDRRRDWDHRDSRDHDHLAGGAGTGGGEGPGRKSVGRVYCGGHYSDRDVHGRLFAVLARGQSHGSFSHWRRLPVAGCLGRKTSPPESCLGARVWFARHHGGLDDHHLWTGSQRAAGVAALGPARLPEHFHEAGHDFRAGSRDFFGAAQFAHAGYQPVR